MATNSPMKKEFKYSKDEIRSSCVNQILWTRDDNDGFINQDFIRDMGDCFSERTASSCSWGFDEYEVKSTKKISASLDAVEEALYEGVRDPLLNNELYEECQKWSQKFLHLRLRGNELVPINADITATSSPTDDTIKHIELSIPFSSDEDKTFVPASSVDYWSDNNSEADEDSDQEKLSLENDDLKDNCLLKPRIGDCYNRPNSTFDKNNSTSAAPFSVDYITNKVIERLSSKVWAKVLSRWGKAKENESCGESESNDFLPPIPSSQEVNSKSKFQRPWTRGKTPKSSDFPKLDGILTVSPKVLQKRPHSRIRSGASQRTRPNTGVSVMSYSSIGSFHNPIMPVHPIKSLEKTLSDDLVFSTLSKKSLEKESEFLTSSLPVVEENGLLSQVKLIDDLYIKDTFPKLRLSEAPGFPVKPTFLPPIDDRDLNWNCSNQDLQRPISYESHLPGYKKHNQSSIYTRHLNKISVRPSTTKTSWDMRNSNFDIKKHNVISPVENRSILSQKKLTPEHVDNLVSLFPIVTSLEPKQLIERHKNHNFNRKNTALGAFPKKNKR